MCHIGDVPKPNGVDVERLRKACRMRVSEEGTVRQRLRPAIRYLLLLIDTFSDLKKEVEGVIHHSYPGKYPRDGGSELRWYTWLDEVGRQRRGAPPKELLPVGLNQYRCGHTVDLFDEDDSVSDPDTMQAESPEPDTDED